jgi:hypothetical protein
MSTVGAPVTLRKNTETLETTILPAVRKASQTYLLASAEAPPEHMFVSSVSPYRNVVAVGCGYKVVREVSSDINCVSFFVARKFPRETLPKECLIPAEIDGVPTDVLDADGIFETFAVAPTAEQRRSRPARPGCSIGFELSAFYDGWQMAGTLGAIVQDGQMPYILSANHVLTNADQLSVGAPIYQPGVADGCIKGTDQIAELTRKIPIAQNNVVDCAIARILDPKSVVPDIPRIGRISHSVPAEANRGMRVAKVGRTTGYREGIVRTTDTDVKVRHPRGMVLFSRQVIIESAVRVFGRLVGGRAGAFLSAGKRFSQKGDSGAIIVDLDTMRAIALLSGGSGRYTAACHLNEVLSQLNVTLVV